MKKLTRLDEIVYQRMFDMEEFKHIDAFSGRVDYCGSRLRQMGRDSSRMVFEGCRDAAKNENK